MQQIDLQIKNLTHTYPAGVQALRGVNLEIPSGASIAIIGQNGAGKTTLVKHFNGLLRPTTGSVYLGARDTAERSVAQLAAVVGYVFQNPDEQLFQPTVNAEIAFGPKNLGRSAEVAQELTREALEVVGLAQVADLHPYDLSPGERKRVALAAVLAMQTPVVVLDEPTTGQDQRDVERIGRIIEMLKEGGKTVITISHDIDFCAEHFSRIVVMQDGLIVLDGTGAEVFAQTDILARTYVEPPQMIRLAARLKMAAMPLTVDSFVQAWISARESD